MVVLFCCKVESQGVPLKAMGKKGVKRGRQTSGRKEPSPSLKTDENPSNDIHNKYSEDQNQMKRGRSKRLKREAYPVKENGKKGENAGNSGELVDQKQLLELNNREVERRIVAIQAICDAQIEHVLTQLRVARSMFSKEQLSMPLLQFLKEYCPNTIAIKNSEGIIEFEKNTQNYDVDGSHVGEKEWRKSVGCQGSISVDDQTVMPTPVGFHFTSSAVKEKFLRSIGIHVSNLAFEENSEIKIIDGENSFETPNTDCKTRSSIGITPKTQRLPKRGEMLLSVHGSPLVVYCEDKMDTISEADKEP
ncbi:uncharacterized protein LOC131054725 isoform X2 [Cryptomeria japonica]|uniref:uncharacterized protein LOC131054725 isoform X2 n=1 Tax=Cryptomeria japonica TaxID=3369 RepID=UPI0027DA7C91|nr:uncharacterized protein LOC131054725 isoform X2 [Cryptomeria japonica]